MNKRWRNVGLYTLLAVVVIALGTAFFDNKQTQSRETWRYSDFIQEVEKVEKGEKSEVAQVRLTPDRSRACLLYTSPSPRDS